MNLKGSRTEKNLMGAFAGESQARNRYTYFAGQAKKENLIQIAAIFEETANHEKEHAKRLFKLMEGGEAEITAAFPAGTIGTTLENLLASAGGESHENQHMYPDFARIASEEGFDVIARIFKAIAVAETWHEKRFRALAKNIQDGQVFKRPATVKWMCSNCGYVHEGPEAPLACPACAHPQAYYEIAPENF